MDWDSPHPDPFRWGWEEHDLWVTVSRRVEDILDARRGVHDSKSRRLRELHLHSINKTRAIQGASPFSTEGGAVQMHSVRLASMTSRHQWWTAPCTGQTHGESSRPGSLSSDVALMYRLLSNVSDSSNTTISLASRARGLKSDALGLC